MDNSISLTASRKPADHVVSGAIFAAITAGGLGYASANHKDKNDALKNTLKLALQGGIASGSAISCANAIATKNYTLAAISFAIGFGGVVAIEKLIKTKEEFII
ncbi:hypothetical protein [Campylobacter geochelonis]|uniref:Cys/Met metabolism pyridoxal-phosphate-dependent enzyme n=1 Tax=Campylobacter geochelonis TaxID=1780362 RepID=A0A128EJG8_9BACT|nr:hypothetical protein [Campylobacter geochelonis]QKF71733.1 hypothetical protein CGEO_1447 [Campylobacter geochelonis]CZE47630.1 Cys/Met metabolism pyridoxal-phosphate-dependent enzyme [Campylobacter geochelonis]CZE48552.1 Cys/Met metabolism pyridoxal-phosphate-dependent enzyme [Campylobacter geochelonis]CZE51152.1 Cys/Met metabolism pyridoxal-phosphate-dependent enzyme [Campylobacter geochelonis]